MTVDRSPYRVEPLGPSHDRAAFSCAVAPLDRYLQQQARQDMERRVAAVFVLTSDSRVVAGFYTLSAVTVRLGYLPAELARKLPRYPDIPATLIGRLAISLQHRGQGLGELLLLDALHRALQHSNSVASFAVVVDAKDEGAARYYLKYGFLPLVAPPNRLFLPMATIENLFAK
ncbi:MAG: GNAT family N-acetyltransferase [Acidobacteria bacterium]|nr:GNAT family N-acetyltransferase [Acidobacteriota bacterium]